MPIYAERNLYPGVNAHLNTELQLARGESWESFHTDYITFLRTMLDRVLPVGYYAISERSLQISEYERDPDIPARRLRTKADVLVERGAAVMPSGTHYGVLVTAPPAYQLPMPEVIEPEDALRSVTIFQAGATSAKGTPITRIELLSPANKPGQSHYEAYITKRVNILKSGLRLVEIDLLHFYPPIRTAMPKYIDHDADAAPYVILVSDPRPFFEQGVTNVYPFGVIDPIPSIDVPLDGGDWIGVDFGQVYHGLFASSRLFQRISDYATDPPAFDRFTPADQAALSAFLAQLRTQHTREEP
jgi:hypothetical protein